MQHSRMAEAHERRFTSHEVEDSGQAGSASMGCERGRAQGGRDHAGQRFVSCSTRTAGEVNRHGINVLMLDHSQVVQAAAR
jgi:hypothetical protein